MSSIWNSIMGCCASQPEEEGPDTERTPLLNPDILPEAPIQAIGKSTEDQVAEQETLRSIFSTAAARFVDIESATPFTRPENQSPYSSRSVSPTSFLDQNQNQNHLHPNSSTTSTNQIRNSLWRAPADDTEGISRGRVKVVHLGTHFEPHASTSKTTQTVNKSNKERNNGNGNGGLVRRPPSSHSLRTISGKGSGNNRLASPLSNSKAEGRESINSNLNPEEENEEEDGDESLYGTMTSYRTARENSSSTLLEGGAFRAAGGDARTALKDIWRSSSGSRDSTNGSSISVDTGDTEEDNNTEDGISDDRSEETMGNTKKEEELAIALQKLEESMKDFKIVVTEPLTFDLSAERS